MFILIVGGDGVRRADEEVEVEVEVETELVVLVEGESGSERITTPLISSYYIRNPKSINHSPNRRDHSYPQARLIDRGRPHPPTFTPRTHLDHPSIDSHFLP